MEKIIILYDEKKTERKIISQTLARTFDLSQNLAHTFDLQRSQFCHSFPLNRCPLILPIPGPF